MGAEDPNVGRALKTHKLRAGSEAGQQRVWVLGQGDKLGTRTAEPEALGRQGLGRVNFEAHPAPCRRGKGAPTFLLNISHHGWNITPF